MASRVCVFPSKVKKRDTWFFLFRVLNPNL
jgi:hypothetical protein